MNIYIRDAPSLAAFKQTDKEIRKNSPDSIFGATLISVHFPATIRISMKTSQHSATSSNSCLLDQFCFMETMFLKIHWNLLVSETSL